MATRRTRLPGSALPARRSPGVSGHQQRSASRLGSAASGAVVRCERHPASTDVYCCMLCNAFTCAQCRAAPAADRVDHFSHPGVSKPVPLSEAKFVVLMEIIDAAYQVESFETQRSQVGRTLLQESIRLQENASNRAIEYTRHIDEMRALLDELESSLVASELLAVDRHDRRLRHVEQIERTAGVLALRRKLTRLRDADTPFGRKFEERPRVLEAVGKLRDAMEFVGGQRGGSDDNDSRPAPQRKMPIYEPQDMTGELERIEHSIEKLLKLVQRGGRIADTKVAPKRELMQLVQNVSNDTLFDSNDKEQIQLLGIAVEPNTGHIFLSDSLNGKIKRYDVSTGAMRSVYVSDCRLGALAKLHDGTGFAMVDCGKHGGRDARRSRIVVVDYLAASASTNETSAPAQRKRSAAKEATSLAEAAREANMEILQAVPMLEESSMCQSGIVQLRNGSLLASVWNYENLYEVARHPRDRSHFSDHISAMHRLPGRFRALAYSRGSDILAVTLKDGSVRLMRSPAAADVGDGGAERLQQLCTLKERDLCAWHVAFFEAGGGDLLVANWNEKVRHHALDQFDAMGSFRRRVSQPTLDVWSWSLEGRSLVLYDQAAQRLRIYNLIDTAELAADRQWT